MPTRLNILPLSAGLPPRQAVAPHPGGLLTATQTASSPARTHLDLRLRHPQRVRQPRPLGASQVLGLLESLLQREDLVAREGGPGVFFLMDAVAQGVRGWREEGSVPLMC